MPQQQYIKFLYEEEGSSISEIINRVGVDWRTAAKYAKKDDWNEKPRPLQRQRPVMDPVAEVVDIWLMEDMLKPRKDRRTATAIFEQLKKEYDFQGSGRTVRGYVSQRKKELKAQSQERFLELVSYPGHAQADFGIARVVWGGELREINCLVISFPYSNGGFCVPLPSENTECFLHGLSKIFDWINGVPQKIRFDNLTAAVATVGKGEERILTKAFARFVLHYRFKPEFCGVGKANQKGHVENKVGYIRRNWLLPYPEVSSYEELTAELYKRALADFEREHYKKGVHISRLWEEEQKALLPLPTVPFEPLHMETARVNNYSQIQFRGETYDVPRAQPGETVYLRLWWDRLEVFRNQEHLVTLPRHYLHKTQPIDWESYFDLFVKKPRGARHAAMWRHLPEPVRDYLESDDNQLYRERLQFIHTLLKEGFGMELISRVLAEADCVDPGVIRHNLYRLAWPNSPLEAINETYTPESVRNYEPQVDLYDQLLPARKGGEPNAELVFTQAM